MDLKLGDSRLIIDACAKQGLLRNQAAYVLATAYHETAHTVKPITEMGSQKYLKSKKYWPFIGRGYVQLTWKTNYADWSKRLGVDLVAKPQAALNPANACRILVQGMVLGTFTKKKLADYVTVTKSDFVGARRIINGIDKADLIAGYAKDYDVLLRADGYGEAPKPILIPDNGTVAVLEQQGDKVTVTVAPAPPDEAAPAPNGKLSAIATVLALAAMALAGFWHHVTDLFWSIF